MRTTTATIARAVACTAAAWATADWATSSGARWATVFIATCWWYSWLLGFARGAYALARRSPATTGPYDVMAASRSTRPREVIIGGQTLAVQPLTMPTMVAMNAPELTQPVQALVEAAGPGGGSYVDPDLMTAAYAAMYGQLAVLLRDPATGEQPDPEYLQVYLPVTQLAELLSQLGPGAPA